MGKKHEIRNVTVYCASSSRCDAVYFQSARQLGEELALNDIGIVYGGGGIGLMGTLADSAIAKGGRVIGIIPQFMTDLEWGHRSLTELRIARDMHERKRMMIEETDAFVALPGGCGTLEELFEAITWKRLGLHTKPILLVNIQGFFDPCIQLLEQCIENRFMDSRHRNMWASVEHVGDVIRALHSAPPWDESSRDFAVL